LQTKEGLISWELQGDPWSQSPVSARRLPNHRLDYLDFEGAVSQNRGSVERIRFGRLQWCQEATPELGAWLTDQHGDRWLVRWFPLGPGRESPTEADHWLELLPQSAQPIVKSGAVAVICREQRFLVIQRSQLVRAPGQFCFPGGTIEPNESVTDALVREIQEELAIDIEPQRHLWTSLSSWGVQLHWWLVDYQGETLVVPNEREVAWFGWLTPSELAAKHPLLPSNRLFLEAWHRQEFSLPIQK
jgi:8-oxo-dGTP diphosphatase